MATIEPRLIHLLNGSNAPQGQHATSTDLPPLQGLPTHTSSGRPLPLEPDAGHRVERSVEGQHGYFHYDSQSGQRRDATTGVHPLRLLLSETNGPENSQLARHGDEMLDDIDDGAYQKRPYSHNTKDDFVQLPQPLKKQRMSPQPPVMPPIINGLHEPPPHAALFPPISAGSRASHEVYPMNPGQSFSNPWEDRSLQNQQHHQPWDPDYPVEKASAKTRKRATKPRRKWTEQETNQLLLGVNRHGVGKWTSILEDSDYSFNERTAGDLKDRFRTCCPDELRSKRAGSGSAASSSRDTSSQPATGLHSENILIDDGHSDEPAQHDSDSGPRRRKSRAHRKRLEDLVELGISAPFKKSHRRERRPFTDKDDREILDGLEMYGPAWTKIQRDPRFDLSARQPTDLRDRVRNKYPEIYQRIEKGAMQARENTTRNHDTLAPISTTRAELALRPVGNAHTMEPRVNGSDSREELGWRGQAGEPMDISQGHGSIGAEGTMPHLVGGEMGISRLLLNGPRRQSEGQHDNGMLSEASSPSTASSISHRGRP